MRQIVPSCASWIYRSVGLAALTLLLGAEAPATRPASAPATGTKVEIPGTVVSFELVKVTAGKVTLKETDGTEKTVDVKAFSIGRHEVTWDEYDLFTYRLDLPEKDRATGADAAARPSRPYIAMDRNFGHAGFPALSMTHHGAEKYCEWLSAKTGKKYRLPTEAEWVLAARAGGMADMTRDEINRIAWTDDNADGFSHAVGKKPANGLGLYDMLGSVAEWVTRGNQQPCVIGGSFLDAGDVVGVTMKETYIPDWQANDPQVPKSVWWLANVTHIGMRVVCEE